MGHSRLFLSITIILSVLAGSGVAAAPAAPGGLFVAEASEENIELLGHLGGIAQTIEVEGSYAYVGFGPELAVLDVSDPTHIQRVGWLVAAGEVRDIEIEGEFAYIAYGGLISPTGLQVIRISDPNMPTTISILEFSSPGCSPLLVINGSSAYVTYQLCNKFPSFTCGQVLHRLDISNPYAPITMDTYSNDCSTGAAYITDLAATDTWLYSLWWTYDYYYMQIFDTSHPQDMIEVATYAIGSGGGAEIALAGDYALIAAGSDGLKVVDISDPAQPAAVITFTLPDRAIGILYDETTAYLTLNSESIFVLNVADPLNPVYVGTYHSTGQSEDIFVSAEIAYSANGWNGVEIFDAAALTRSGVFELPQHPNQIVYSEPYAFIAADNGFWVTDLSNPGMPLPVAHVETDTPVVSLVLIGNYAYLAFPDFGVGVLDISDPLSPEKFSFYIMTADIRQLTVFNNHLYVAAGLDGLHVLSTGNPGNLYEVGAYIPGYSINALDVNGSYAYLATDNGTLPVIDISNLQEITQVGAYDYPDDYPSCRSAMTVAAEANVVYHGGSCSGPTPLAGIHGFIRLVDFTDVGNPIEIDVLQDANIPTWISIDGQRAYVKSYVDGLKVYGIHDPVSPQLIGWYTPPAGLDNYLDLRFGVTASSEYIFLYGNSVFILRYIDPGLPTISGSITQANGQPYSGVLLSAGAALAEKVSDIQGAYAFRGVPEGTYTLTPSLPGYAFHPPSRTVSVPPSVFGQNFTILPEPVQLDFTPGISATLRYTDTQGLPTWLDIPGDASATPLTLQVVPTIGAGAPDYAFAGHAFELNAAAAGEGAVGFVFNAPLTATIQYSPWDVAVITDPDNLALWWWDGAAWQDAARSCSPAGEYSRDTDNYTLSLPICQTGVYKLMGLTNQVHLPLIFSDD